MVAGFWLLASGCLLLVACIWLLVTCNKTQSGGLPIRHQFMFSPGFSFSGGLQLPVTETFGGMIIDHPGCLHVGIHNG